MLPRNQEWPEVAPEITRRQPAPRAVRPPTSLACAEKTAHTRAR